MFTSYLSNRYQVVRTDEYCSSPKHVKCGVPQGSILGPLLFSIYINDISKLSLKGDITLYADDTSLFYFGNTINDIITDAQHDLNFLNVWFQCNLLTINANKTNYMIYSAKNKKIADYEPLKINNHPINKVDKEKFLGLILDKHLNWKPHIEKMKA